MFEVYIVLICVVLDVLSGVVKSFVNKKTFSETFYVGIVKKISIFFLIALAYLVDLYLNMNKALFTSINVFFISCEGLSILENCGEIGVPLPNKLKEALEVMKK